MIEIKTTIKNGLPVLARGKIIGPDPSVGYFDCSIEDLDLFWLSGHPCRIDITVSEEERIVEELLAHNSVHD